MATKSMQRSLKRVKELGWTYWRTEHWNQYTHRREDMFNFCDIICLDGHRTIAIQATGTDMASHRHKLRDNIYLVEWLQEHSNRELQMWSWRKLLKKRGGKLKIWKCKTTNVTVVHNEIYFEEM